MESTYKPSLVRLFALIGFFIFIYQVTLYQTGISEEELNAKVFENGDAYIVWFVIATILFFQFIIRFWKWYYCRPTRPLWASLYVTFTCIVYVMWIYVPVFVMLFFCDVVPLFHVHVIAIVVVISGVITATLKEKRRIEVKFKLS